MSKPIDKAIVNLHETTAKFGKQAIFFYYGAIANPVMVTASYIKASKKHE